MKDHLIFDVTDANTILDSDSVGAFLRASDGTLLTHTDVSGKKALDVRLAEGVNVEVDLSHVDDSVRLGDGTAFFTSTSENSDVALDVHISNSSLVVTASDLDIRDLDSAQDSIAAVQSGTWNIATLTGITNDVNIADGGNSITIDDGGASLTVDGTVAISGTVAVTQSTSPWVISATDLDIRDLSAAQDSVQSNLFDGAGVALTSTLIGSDQALDINVVQSVDPSVANTAILSAADTLAAAGTAEKVVASNLAARKKLFVYNNDNRKMYIGSSGVDKDNGFPVSPGSYMEIAAGPAVDVYYDSEKTGLKIRTLELS